MRFDGWLGFGALILAAYEEDFPVRVGLGVLLKVVFGALGAAFSL